MRIFLVDLESVETRYTCQWKIGLPELLKKEAEDRGFTASILPSIGYVKDLPDLNILDIVIIEGGQVSQKTTPGAFLNFAGTNVYKSKQVIEIAHAFQRGMIRPGDKILVTDAWNPGIIQFKYMSELLNIPVEIHALWHAGSYDPQDFLGRLIEDKRWSINFEKSLFHAIDYNYFATVFHRDMFAERVNPETYPEDMKKYVVSGQPHNLMVEELLKYRDLKKKDLILFPHRVAPEKQPDIFKDLAKSMPEYEWVICQDQDLSKAEYHTMMGEAKMMFSANLQETLGISAMEAVLLDTIPLLPARLSYIEMYESHFKYPSIWTENWDAYQEHKEELMDRIRKMLNWYDNFGEASHSVFEIQRKKLLKDYLYPGPMIDHLLGEKE